MVYNDLSALLGIISKQIDILFLGYFRNPMEVGFYKLAKNLASVIGYVVKPLQAVIYIRLSFTLGADDARSFRTIVRRATYTIGVPLTLLWLAGSIFVPWFIPQSMGMEYHPAIFLTQVLFIAYSGWLLFFWLRPAYLAQGLVKQWSIGIGLYTTAFSIFGVLLIPLLGANGLVFAQLFVVWAFHLGMGVRLYASL